MIDKQHKNIVFKESSTPAKGKNMKPTGRSDATDILKNELKEQFGLSPWSLSVRPHVLGGHSMKNMLIRPKLPPNMPCSPMGISNGQAEEKEESGES
ncbi:unnamed protein product [Lupinus luteus]|uniref:Uncharacterized protein n=1 Tax=Lupinus luteus TaxID=3873 RepID=A0AAV1WL86_LUPLU